MKLKELANVIGLFEHKVIESRNGECLFEGYDMSNYIECNVYEIKTIHLQSRGCASFQITIDQLKED